MNQITKCPICNSEEIKSTFPNYKGYDLVKCRKCNVEFALPFKCPDPEEFYSNSEDLASKERHEHLFTWYTNHPSQQSKFLENGQGKKLLDIGCGNGAFVEFAEVRGFDVVGLDLDTYSLEMAKRRNLKARLFKSDLKNYITENPDVKFDIITMFEVLEHLDNPKEILELVYQLLKPGGLFIGSLPNEDRFLAKKINMDFASPPFHLTYWTCQSFTHVLENNFNFSKITCASNIYYGYVFNVSKHLLMQKHSVRQNSLLGIAIRGSFWIMKQFERPIEKLLQNGSSFYFEFKK